MTNEVNRRRSTRTTSANDDTSEPYSSDGDVHSFCSAIGMNMCSYRSQDALMTAVSRSRSNQSTTANSRKETRSKGTVSRQDKNKEQRIKELANMLRFDPRQKDFDRVFEEKLSEPFPAESCTIEWADTVKIVSVNMHGRQPQFEKHTDRIVPNQWRRIGPCKKIHEIGGYVAMGKRRSTLKEVKKGTGPPKTPPSPQFTVHRDEYPHAVRKAIALDVPRAGVPGVVAARICAQQIEDRVVEAWKSESWYDLKDDHPAGITLQPRGTSRTTVEYAKEKQQPSSTSSSSSDSLKSTLRMSPKK